jgi:hypothetical protein
MIEVSRKAVQQAGWSSNDVLNQHGFLSVQQIYLKTLSGVFKTGKAQTLASPTTTLGNTFGCP